MPLLRLKEGAGVSLALDWTGGFQNAFEQLGNGHQEHVQEGEEEKITTLGVGATPFVHRLQPQSKSALPALRVGRYVSETDACF